MRTTARRRARGEEKGAENLKRKKMKKKEKKKRHYLSRNRCRRLSFRVLHLSFCERKREYIYVVNRYITKILRRDPSIVHRSVSHAHTHGLTRTYAPRARTTHTHARAMRDTLGSATLLLPVSTVPMRRSLSLDFPFSLPPPPARPRRARRVTVEPPSYITRAAR